jgi:molecular chaperone DnaK
VSAKDKGTGKENKITIKANSGLSEAEIAAMVKDAEANAEEDKKALAVAKARNEADSLIHSTKKSLNEHGSKISVEEKTAIEAALTELESVAKSGDVAEITAKIEVLSTASQKLGEAVYAEAAASAEQANTEPTAAKPQDDNVVDANFKEVKR